MDRSTEARDRLLARLQELGFARVGVCRARPSDHRAEMVDWIASNRHGSMGYLEQRLEERLDPQQYLPGMRSIICVADRYHDGGRDRVERGLPARGRIARYARGRDYHKVMKKRLVTVVRELAGEHPSEEFRACVDTAPLLEREHAARAGIGLIGKHSLLIEPGVGSWMCLGAIVTTLDIAETPSTFDREDPCGECTRCIDACPTDAITPFSVDASRCIAYTSIEHRGDIEPAIAEATGDWLFGCDICQEVCPHSARPKRRAGSVVNDAYASRVDGFDLLEVLGWSEEDRMERLMGSAAKRATLVMWKRNAIVCAANSLREEPERVGSASLRQRLREIASNPEEDELVRRTAQGVLGNG
ncbi:MAG: tRNA epoxyqueuosine(34) reductase QueG [Phycisphaerales bacterium]|nr:tRNA epoxyqueuosine(34) reductase QueG [Phycisphaerales bacterium]